MTRRNVRKQEWVFPLFSPDADDRLSLNFHRFVILYISCDTRSVGLGQHCLPKVYNGFKAVLLLYSICPSFFQQGCYRHIKKIFQQLEVCLCQFVCSYWQNSPFITSQQFSLRHFGSQYSPVLYSVVRILGEAVYTRLL